MKLPVILLPLLAALALSGCGTTTTSRAGSAALMGGATVLHSARSAAMQAAAP